MMFSNKQEEEGINPAGPTEGKKDRDLCFLLDCGWQFKMFEVSFKAKESAAMEHTCPVQGGFSH